MAEIEYSREGHVAHVRLNRPNSLNAAMETALAEAWSQINTDPEVWVAVLSAEGERAFCAGGDVSGEGGHAARVAFGGGITGVGGPLVKLKKPLVAAVHGYVLG